MPVTLLTFPPPTFLLRFEWVTIAAVVTMIIVSSFSAVAFLVPFTGQVIHQGSMLSAWSIALLWYISNPASSIDEYFFFRNGIWWMGCLCRRYNCRRRWINLGVGRTRRMDRYRNRRRRNSRLDLRKRRELHCRNVRHDRWGQLSDCGSRSRNTAGESNVLANIVSGVYSAGRLQRVLILLILMVLIAFWNFLWL